MPPDSFWLDEAQLLFELLVDSVEAAASSGMSNAVEMLIRILGDRAMPSVNFDFVPPAAHAYAQQHTYDLVSGVTSTSREWMRKEFSDWVSSGEHLDALTDRLVVGFGEQRAEMIASTEVTRIYAESNQRAWLESGVVDAARWQTAVDDIVCPICWPLHGNEYPLTEKEAVPPAHPRCRCWLQPIVKVPA